MSTRRRRTVAATALMLGLLGIGLSGLGWPVWASHTTFAIGDVFVAVGKGKVQWRHPNGELNKMLDTGTGSNYTAGMAFDAAGNLYVTNFSTQSVSKFDPTGTLLGPFGTGYDRAPESIVFDEETGNAYVGQAYGTKHILKFNAAGTLLQAFNVPTEVTGSDWIALAADRRTMFYTSEGRTIKRYDVVANVPLPDFVTGLPGERAYALRLLPGGGLLVADRANVLRFDDAATIVQTYDAAGQDNWFALNLDPDGTSFWSADLQTGDVYKFELATGKVLLSFHAKPETQVGGLAVKGEILPRRVLAHAGDTLVELTWSPPPAGLQVAGYRVYRAGSTRPIHGERLLPQPHFRDMGLSNGRAETYVIIAVLADGTEWKGYQQVTSTPEGK